MNIIRNAAIALAASGTLFAAAPAAALELPTHSHAPAAVAVDSWDYGRDNRWNDRRDRRDDRRYRNNRNYGEPVYRDTRAWRGRDGNTYCQKKDGTTGLIVGGAAGALLGREIDSRGDRTLGTLLGAAGGALLGREVDRGLSCR